MELRARPCAARREELVHDDLEGPWQRQRYEIPDHAAGRGDADDRAIGPDVVEEATEAAAWRRGRRDHGVSRRARSRSAGAPR